MIKGKIRVAIIGTGRISDLHAIEYLHNPDTEIVALCDSDIDLAKTRAKKWGCGKSVKIEILDLIINSFMNHKTLFLYLWGNLFFLSNSLYF